MQSLCGNTIGDQFIQQWQSRAVFSLIHIHLGKEGFGRIFVSLSFIGLGCWQICHCITQIGFDFWPYLYIPTAGVIGYVHSYYWFTVIVSSTYGGIPEHFPQFEMKKSAEEQGFRFEFHCIGSDRSVASRIVRMTSFALWIPSYIAAHLLPR